MKRGQQELDVAVGWGAGEIERLQAEALRTGSTHGIAELGQIWWLSRQIIEVWVVGLTLKPPNRVTCS